MPSQAEGNDVLACSCGASGRLGCAGFRISGERGGSRRGSPVDFRAVSGRVPVPSVWLGQMVIRGLRKGLLPQTRLPELSRALSYPPAWDQGLRRPEIVRGDATPGAGFAEELTPSNYAIRLHNCEVAVQLVGPIKRLRTIPQCLSEGAGDRIAQQFLDAHLLAAH